MTIRGGGFGRNAAVSTITVALIIFLTGCGPANPDLRPEDSKLRDGISLLIKDLDAHHPQSKNWDQALVDAQLKRALPKGVATPAGWKLTWVSPAPSELPYVYVPWSLIGQYPNHFTSENANYSGGTPVPSTVMKDLANQQFGDDEYFAAIVSARYSKVDAKWVVFTSVPYLPVTDNAYGWATASNGRWKIIDFGTAVVGCGRVPAAVQNEFGFTCPSN